MEKHPIILDCDPGVDDVVAILYAAAHLDIVGLTTVHGNVPVEQATRNALRVLELAGIDVPVVRGMGRPLINPPQHAPEIHGSSGLAGTRLPEPTRKPLEGHAVEFIIEETRRSPGLALVTLGPLTNVAMALRLDPTLAERLALISVMGGSTGRGNVTPVAEFNVHSDPEAAHVVLTSGVPVYMVGLNVTHRVGVTRDHVNRLRASGRRTAAVVADMLAFFLEQQRREYGRETGPLHDPCALVPLIEPRFIRYRLTRVEVELGSPLTRGMTVWDLRHAAERPLSHGKSNARVAVDVQVEPLLDHVLDAVLRYP